MPSCEKCWRDSGGNPKEYHRLLRERSLTPCPPEAQAGPDAGICPRCNRRTVHQYAGICVVCGYDQATK